MSNTKKKRYTAEQAFNDIARSISEARKETRELKSEVTQFFAPRVIALEQSGVERSRLEKLEADIRFLLKSEKDTRDVLKELLAFMRIGRKFSMETADNTEPTQNSLEDAKKYFEEISPTMDGFRGQLIEDKTYGHVLIIMTKYAEYVIDKQKKA